ncbi:MAG: putative NurA protein [Nitrososphaeraceae archaeon]|nr:putative NurA protein [Nitrososphaeraceae archaeon]
MFYPTLGHCLPSELHKALKGKKIIFSVDEKNLVPIEGWGKRPNPYCAETITTIQPIKGNTMVAALDSSSIQIAETEDGILYAVKSGIAISVSEHALVHFKIGPILFYLSEETIKQSELDHRLTKLVLFDSDSAKRLIRIRVERAIQMELSSHFTKSIILIDGSLKSSLFENKSQGITKVAENCLLNKNSIVGISKNTKIKILDSISSPLTKIRGPAYMDIEMIILGNDSIAGGYPETLRLAHHISTFTSTEISCLRSHVLNNYDVIELASEDIRRTLLGSIPI